jgi:hypothetical protein
MPSILYGDYTDSVSIDLNRAYYPEYREQYPANLNLRPNSKAHKKLLSSLLRRARESANFISKRFGSWEVLDHKLTTYISTSEAEKILQEKDEHKPVSIVFPYSYALLETILGYMVSAFFQEPIFRFEAGPPEAVMGAIMLEKTIDQQCHRFKTALSLHTWFRDAMVYGFGAAAPNWTVIRGKRRVAAQNPNLFSRLMNRPQTTEMQEVTLFEGNRIYNIDPYLVLPDPNVPMVHHQDGEYFGWIEKTSYPDILDRERSGEFFNAKYLKHITDRRSNIHKRDASGREKKTGGKIKHINESLTSPTDIIHITATIIPNDWELGNSEYPEKWKFAVGADQVILDARPMGLDHGMYPVSIIAPDSDGYSSSPISRMEILYGLQHTLDFMFNSHIANVRKAINDMFVVDPYLVNVHDLADPKPGKVIRTRRPAWGRGVKDAIQQLNVNDITSRNIADGSFIMQYMQKIGGPDDSTMGSLRQGGPERLTSEEYQGTRQGTFSRLERIARLISVQGMQDLGYLMASHTQQFMKEEVYTDVYGRWQQRIQLEFGHPNNKMLGPDDRLKVRPQDILIPYDVKVRDGSVPGSNYSRVWEKLFELLVSEPHLSGTFDIVRVFKHIARNNGAKNADEFVIPQAQMMPDQQAEAEAAKGNLVPTSEVVPNG